LEQYYQQELSAATAINEGLMRPGALTRHWEIVSLIIQAISSHDFQMIAWKQLSLVSTTILLAVTYTVAQDSNNAKNPAWLAQESRRIHEQYKDNPAKLFEELRSLTPQLFWRLEPTSCMSQTRDC